MSDFGANAGLLPFETSSEILVPKHRIKEMHGRINQIPLRLFEVQLDLSLSLMCSNLCKDLNPLIEYVYNPIDYAKDNYQMFLQTYISASKKLLFLGMNPGPWGMMQTGIPFGEVNIVRDWLKLNGNIVPPQRQHPLRPVQGFDCTRSEISGKRFWALAKDLSKNDPFLFFKNTFVYNYYPLALLSETGKNITPSDLKAGDIYGKDVKSEN